MFVLLLRVAYEGDVLLGVYSSRELAEAAWRASEFAPRDDEYVIYEVSVDAPAEYRW